MLLAILASEIGRVLSVDRLVESLWPGRPPDTAAHAVQVYVSQLRKALGPDVIATRPPGYALELDPGCVDVQRFARLVGDGREALGTGDPASASSALREALALWRGPALADFMYEPFAQTEIARLDEMRVVALEERIDADLALGRHADLVSEIEALVSVQPLRERPRGQLMLALYRSGRQADALATYREARETLVEELGIDPGPELRRLEAAILRQDDSLLPLDGPAAPAMQFRRLVTVLFVDLVESMALAGVLDAEAVARVLSGYFETVSAALVRHGGTVEKYAGDAVMAVFGIPVSHEDDALRAARAAMDIRAAVAALDERLVGQHGVGLEIRIGLESGEVVTTPTETRQRLVTGEAVGVASKLEQAAGAGEIVVGELAARLIDHAARLEAVGKLEVKGLRRPVPAFRLLELESVSPAFERRLEARLVGRKRQLATLRRSLKRAVEGASAHAVVVVGSPGVGKTRLAAELVARAKGVTALWGRCLPYGEGITYWPVREMLQHAPASDERDALLAALDVETPLPAAEIAWSFRRLCEAIARTQPLLLVFDDLHWGEPTFLELVEQLTDKGEGPILVVGLARDELFEDHPEFLGGLEGVYRIALDSLSAEDSDALLDALGGEVLETDQRTRIVRTAEGNPLFLEQLLALGLEGGLSEQTLPLTLQALLAARLDRLGPGERAVLERGSIVLRSFTHDDVLALLEPEAAPTVGTHLQTLVDRGFLRPDADTFRFRHVVVQDAVYRAAPKRLRAELHERFADRLDSVATHLPELDEFVGYHLERAYRLRMELGESDRRTERLAEDGGRRLGASGLRALKRADMPASVNLLDRATSLLPAAEGLRRELLCELGIARTYAGDSSGARASLSDAMTASRDSGDRRLELRARLELEFIRLNHEPERTASDLLATADEGIPLFESVGDQRALGRAWLVSGWARGGHRGDHRTWAEAAERALSCYRAAGWPVSTCISAICAAHYWGPTPVADGVRRLDELRRKEVLALAGSAYVEVFLGGLRAQQGDFERARALVESARTTLAELGLQRQVDTYCSHILGEIELLAGDAGAAEIVFRELCARLELSQDFGHLASRASDLAETLIEQGRYEEADHWTHVAEQHAAADDVDAHIRWRPIRAKIHARNGEFAVARRLAGDAVRLAASTDHLNRCARAHRDQGQVLGLVGLPQDAIASLERALELFEEKGNVVEAARTRALLNHAVFV